jgi:hypothetical protein
MSKLLVAVLAAFLGAGLAQAAGTHDGAAAARSKRAHRVRHASGATVMSLTRPKPCAPGLVKRARGCVSSALAIGPEADDTSVMGDIGERPHGRVVVHHHGRHLHPR